MSKTNNNKILNALTSLNHNDFIPLSHSHYSLWWRLWSYTLFFWFYHSL